MSTDSRLFSPRADERLTAAREAGRRARRTLDSRVRDWPAYSPGAVNSWLLLVTTKPPVWRDSFVSWVDHPPTLGAANEGFYYPDPLGFWSEIRRWALEIFHLLDPAWNQHDALTLTSLIHVGEDAASLTRAFEVSSPQVVLFLDEPSWVLSGLDVTRHAHFITDPHRPAQVYEGFWGRTADGRVVGKSPQHPTMHKLYRREDMVDFLRSAPVDSGERKAGASSQRSEDELHGVAAGEDG
jgi:hypothetical protein